MATLRAFVGIALDESLRGPLAACASRLEATLPAKALRLVAPESFHLTLRFLGEVDVADVDSLAAALSATRPAMPFEARLIGLAALPSIARPNVLVAEVESGAALTELASFAERVAVERGWSPESRPFRPHITLARVRRNVRLGRSLPPFDLSGCVLGVDAFALFQSELRPEGARYTILRRFDLGPPTLSAS